MSGYLSPKAAAKFPCPLARVNGDGAKANCRADKCIIWRWRNPPEFLSAVNREMACLAQDSGGKVHSEQFHSEARSRVANDPAAYGVTMPKDKGYCGLGGAPA